MTKNEYTPRPHWADGTPAWDRLPPEKQLAAMEIEISSYGNRCDHQWNTYIYVRQNILQHKRLTKELSTVLWEKLGWDL